MIKVFGNLLLKAYYKTSFNVYVGESPWITSVGLLGREGEYYTFLSEAHPEITAGDYYILIHEEFMPHLQVSLRWASEIMGISSGMLGMPD